MLNTSVRVECQCGVESFMCDDCFRGLLCYDGGVICTSCHRDVCINCGHADCQCVRGKQASIVYREGVRYARLDRYDCTGVCCVCGEDFPEEEKRRRRREQRQLDHSTQGMGFRLKPLQGGVGSRER